MNTHPNTDRLKQHFQALPEPDLPDGLWARLDGVRQQRLHRRRLGMGVGATAAIALAALLIMPMHGPSPDAPSPLATAPAEVSTTAQPQSIAIQTNTRDQATDQPDNRHTVARLRQLDRHLQAAYRRGSSDAEIAQLWRTRQALLADKRDRVAVTNPIRI